MELEMVVILVDQVQNWTKSKNQNPQSGNLVKLSNNKAIEKPKF